MRGLLTGTVTFLFTDIEGSTELLQLLGDHRYQKLLETYRGVLRAVFEERGGIQVDERGEEFFFVFQRAKDAVTAAVEAQRRVADLTSPEAPSIRYRVGVHTGEPISTGTVYVGLDVHRAARICAAGHGGQILLSQTTADLIRGDLLRHLDLRDLGEHRLKDLQRPERLYQLNVPDLPSVFPPLRSLSAATNNLPFQLTSFIGRQREIAEIKNLLAKHRLVTLTGIGGGGKTRLALQVAADLLEGFAHGVWLVDLGPVDNPELVIPTTAAGVGVSEQPGRALFETLTDHLRGKSVLLILDNCEHLIDACAGVAHELLRRCSGLRILATSRQPLGVTGELQYAVPPLGLPSLTPVVSEEQLAASEAVQLFVERAALGRPAFVLTGRNAQAVARIVAQLDGIPLAIELAAVTTRSLPVPEIATRLEDRFRLLTGGGRTQVARHRTLEAAMDWSYDLLPLPERTLLRRLSVFRGGFSSDAMEQVCVREDGEAREPFDLLLQLVDKSLVAHDPLEESKRYRLLETVREYGEKKLRGAGEFNEIHDRHLEFYLRLAGRADPEQDPAQQEWPEQLGMEHDNLREALQWARVSRKTDDALQLAGALWNFWLERGYWMEGREWLESTLHSYQGEATRGQIKALCGAAALAWRQGDHVRAAALAEESLAKSRLQGYPWGTACSLLNLGILARRKDEYERAASIHEESLGIFRELGNAWGIGWSLRLLAIVLWYRGDYERASALFEESLALYRQRGDQRGAADSLHGLGRVAAYAGDEDRAHSFLLESLRLYEELASPSGVAHTSYVLGRLATRQHDLEEAKALLGKSLALFRQVRDEWAVANALVALGQLDVHRKDLTSAATRFSESLAVRKQLGFDWDRWGIAEFLEGLAELATEQRHFGAAGRLFGAAEAFRSSIGAPLPPSEHRDRQQRLSIIRDGLGEDGFHAAWAAGSELTLDRAIDLAGAVLRPSGSVIQ